MKSLCQNLSSTHGAAFAKANLQKTLAFLRPIIVDSMDKQCDVLCFQTIIRYTFCEKCMCKCKVDIDKCVTVSHFCYNYSLISSISSHVGEGIENAYSLAKATNRFQSKRIPNTLFWFNSARTQNAIHEDQMDLIHTSSALYSINQLSPKFHAFLSSEIPVSRFHVIFFARPRFGRNRCLSSARAFYLGFNSFSIHSSLSCKTFFIGDISHLFFHYALFISLLEASGQNGCAFGARDVTVSAPAITSNFFFSNVASGFWCKPAALIIKMVTTQVVATNFDIWTGCRGLVSVVCVLEDVKPLIYSRIYFI